MQILGERCLKNCLDNTWNTIKKRSPPPDSAAGHQRVVYCLELGTPDD